MNAPALDLEGALLERLVASPALAELVRQLVRAELGRAAPAEPAWISKEEAHRRGFPSASTLRAWQAEGLLRRGRRGRVELAELRALLARRGEEPAPVRLEAERARRAAAAIMQGGRS